MEDTPTQDSFIDQIYDDFKTSHKYFTPLYDEMKLDAEFELGKQWTDDQLNKLAEKGVKGLMINKIRSIIKILTGIERQNKSDLVAFPEGEEDGVTADIVTKLLKNVVKRGKADRRLSQQFKSGSVKGAAYLEPYIDYSQDLLNGEMKFARLNARRVYPDPNFKEYDMSDCRYIIKYTPNLTKEQIEELFPDSDKVQDLQPTRVNFNSEDYLDHEDDGDDKQSETAVRGYDLIEYYYKKPVKKYYIADRVAGRVEEAPDAVTALRYWEANEGVEIITKIQPEIRLCRIVGKTKMDDDVASSYPRWKQFPIIPFFAEWNDDEDIEVEYRFQGIPRQLRDVQFELNKRRTQSLHHLNTSANSGWLTPKGSWTDPDMVRKFGSTPGVNLEYDASKGKPERITPAPLSQAHEFLAQENAQDIKEMSGVNPDLLANDSQSQSGRAILLKQKQGLIMVQEMLDNFSETKKMLGSFILSQLGEIYTVEEAIRVCGDKFIKATFERPQIDPATGQPALDERGELVLAVDEEEVKAVFQKILNDAELGNYDVSIGEGAYSETVKIANYSMLLDLVEKGFPIPPDVLVEESLLPNSSKDKIISALQQASQQQGAAT